VVALPLTPDLIALAAVVVGVLLAAAALQLLSARRRDRAAGHLVAIDAGRPLTMRSERHRISGRPDAVRQLDDGRLVPVEQKTRTTPPRGPPRSHLVQVWAYCLLVEETQGVPPPYGLLRYSDGGEFRITWSASARAELLALRAEMDRPYDGRASPSPGKCAGCRWVRCCDARATGT
jgi:CRISPR-associated exonuclease Cas4